MIFWECLYLLKYLTFTIGKISFDIYFSEIAQLLHFPMSDTFDSKKCFITNVAVDKAKSLFFELYLFSFCFPAHQQPIIARMKLQNADQAQGRLQIDRMIHAQMSYDICIIDFTNMKLSFPFEPLNSIFLTSGSKAGFIRRIIVASNKIQFESTKNAIKCDHYAT